MPIVFSASFRIRSDMNKESQIKWCRNEFVQGASTVSFYRHLLKNCMHLLFPPECPICRKRIDPLLPRKICPQCTGQIRYLNHPVCRHCGMELAGEGDRHFLCGECLRTPPHYSLARSVVRYEAAVKQLVQRLKYAGDTAVVAGIRDILRGYDLTVFDDCRWIIPVPLHASRHRRRGLNQATILAGLFFPSKKQLIKTDWLVRVRNTVPQTSLGGIERRRNLTGAFKVCAPSDLKKAKICLVDDVFTTGTTVGECARVLKSSGAVSVKVLTLARVAVGQRGRRR